MASTKISALPVASTLDGTESIPVVQSGVTKKVTTDQFLIKDGSGNVGVGTASPGAKLHVKDSTEGALDAAQFEANWTSPSGNKSIAWRDNVGALGRISVAYDASVGASMSFGSLYKAGVGYRSDDLMTLTPSGNLGLGVTPSAWGSSYKAIDIGGGMGIAGLSNAAFITSNAYDNGSNYIYKATAAATLNLAINGEHRWYTAPSGTAGNPISFTQVMALNASGVLTLTPTISQAALFNYSGGAYTTWQHSGTSLGDIGAANQVIGGGSSADFAISSRSGSLVLGTANGVERATLAADGRLTLGAATNGAIGGGSGLSMSFETGGTYQGGNIQSFAGNTLNINPLGNAIKFGNGWGKFDASGNLLVGTTSSAGSGVKFATHSAHATGAVAELYASNGAYGGNALMIYANRTTTDGSFNVINYYNAGAGDTRFAVKDSGNVVNTNNSYGAISDLKLKENITDASPKLAKLMQVRIVNYNLKSDTDKTKLIGVVAQELEQVSPGLIEETADRDADGNDLGTTTKSVKYSVFVPMLIKSLQEQQAQIEALEARLAAAGI